MISSAPSFLSDSYAGAGTHRTIKANQPFLVQAWLPALLFSGLFVLESTAALGSDHTSKPLHNFLHLILDSSGLGQSLSQRIDHDWSHLHHILRKAGHFFAYGVFSLICFRSFWITLRTKTSRLHRSLGCHALAVAATILVASADELHQSFLPNRTGSISDVLLDTAGALALQLSLFLILHATRSRRTQPLRLSPSHRNSQSELPIAA